MFIVASDAKEVSLKDGENENAAVSPSINWTVLFGAFMLWSATFLRLEAQDTIAPSLEMDILLSFLLIADWTDSFTVAKDLICIMFDI